MGVTELTTGIRKGRRLLGKISADIIKIENTFYKKSSYTICRLFDKTILCHILDLITSYFSIFKCIIHGGVTPKVIQSDSSAVQMVFLNRLLKLKSDYVESPIKEWNKIKNVLRLLGNFTF